MNTNIKYTITINNKKHGYSLRKTGGGATYVECADAHIAQNFLDEDIPDLLIDLPNLIIAEKTYKYGRDEFVRFRISAKDKKMIEKKALRNGYASVSEYLRVLALSK